MSVCVSHHIFIWVNMFWHLTYVLTRCHVADINHVLTRCHVTEINYVDRGAADAPLHLPGDDWRMMMTTTTLEDTAQQQHTLARESHQWSRRHHSLSFVNLRRDLLRDTPNRSTKSWCFMRPRPESAYQGFLSVRHITDTKNPCVLVLTRCHMLARA